MDRIFDEDIPGDDKPLLKRLMLDYFVRPKSPILAKVRVQGQRLNDDRKFVIGCFAGPRLSIENLIHEMGHFAEREIDKLRKRPHFAWGYSFGKFWRVGMQSGHEPYSAQSVHREIRVWAFQLNLHRHYGIKTDAAELAESAEFLPAFCNYRRYCDPEGAKLRPKDECLAQVTKEIETLADTKFTLKAFNDAWNERIEVLSKQRLRSFPDKI